MEICPGFKMSTKSDIDFLLILWQICLSMLLL
jgi:hypothetical protein